MPIHTVQPGDCIASIAHAYGFSDPKAIFDHADNAELKRKRKDLNVLYPGDRVAVPERVEKEVDCAAGQKHRFTVKLPKVKLHLVLVGPDGEAMSGKTYKLVVGDRTIPGTTTGVGAVEAEVPADATTGTLYLKMRDDDEGDGFPFPLQIGHLDPVEEISGVQARLENSGFHCGGESALGPKTRAALAGFQKKMGLDPTGDLDDDTRTRLRGLHDG